MAKKTNTSSSGGTVDNLNFAVILDDKEFNEKIAQVEKLAQNFNTNITNALNINAKVSAEVQKAAEAERKLAEEKVKAAEADKKLQESRSKAADDARKAEESAAKAQQDALDKTQQVTDKMGQYHLENAKAMERENTFAKTRLDLVQQAAERSKDLQKNFAYLAEEEKSQKTVASEVAKANEVQKQYHLERAKEMEKENAYAKVKLDLVQQATERSKQIKTDFAYLAEMEREQQLLSKTAQEVQRVKEVRKKYYLENAKAMEKQNSYAKINLDLVQQAEERSRSVKSDFAYLAEQEKAQEASRQVLNNARQTTQEVKKTSSALGMANRQVNQISNMIKSSISVYAAKRILENMIQITGEFELQRTTLKAILQDGYAADALFEKIKGLALMSPFNFKDLISYTKQLSAFSVPVEELYDTTKMLADMSAGLGVGMDRLILAYGQVRSASFLRGQEVRQFTESGVPILEALRKEFVALGEEGITVGQVFDKISTRQVPFEMVKKVLVDMTSEGGKFYKMQEVQAETLKGKLSNLKDAYQMFMNDVGSSMDGFLKSGVDGLKRLMDNYEEVGKTILELVATYGIYRVTKAAIIALEKAHTRALLINASAHKMNVTTIQVLNHGLIKQVKNLKLIKGLGNPYVLAAAGIATLAFGIWKYFDATDKAQKATEDFKKSLDEVSERYSDIKSDDEQLVQTIKDETSARAEQVKAIEELNRRYPGIINKYIDEKGHITDLIGLQKALNEERGDNKIEDEAKKLDLYKQKLSDFKRLQEASNKGWSWASAGTTESVYTLTKDQPFWKSNNAYLKEQISYWEELVKKQQEVVDANKKIIIKPTDEELSDFQKAVQNTLKSFNKSDTYAWWTDNKKNTDYFQYLEDIRKRWKEIGEQMKDTGTTQKDLIPDLEKEKTIIETIAKALGINLDTSKETKASTKKTPQQIELENQAEAIKKVHDAYMSLSDYLQGESMTSALSKFFPTVDVNTIANIDDYRGLIENIAKQLERYDKDAADKLRLSVGKDEVTELKERLKSLKEFEGLIKSWKGEDFNLEGTGIGFDVSKIVSDFNTVLGKLDKKRLDALEKLKSAKDNYADEEYNKQVEIIDSLYKKEIEYERKKSQEKINSISNAYVSEKTSTIDNEMRDYGNKTLKQIRKTKEELIELRDAPLLVDEETIKQLNEAGLKLNDLQYAVNDAFRKKINNVQAEELKKVYEYASKAANALSGVASGIKRIGSATGNETLNHIGIALDYTAKLAEISIEAAKSGDYFTASTESAKLVLDAIADSYEMASDKAKKYADELLRASEYQERLRQNKYKSIFGTDELGLALSAIEKYFNSIDSLILKAENGVGKYKNELTEVAKTLGLSIYDSNGNIDLEAVKTVISYIKDTYTFSKKGGGEMLAMLNEIEMSVEQIDGVTEYLEGIFGDLADSIADNMIDAFLKTGDAAYDMSEDVGNIIRNLTADLLKSVLILPKLSEYKDQIMNIWKNPELTEEQKIGQTTQILNGMQGEMEYQIKLGNQILEGIDGLDLGYKGNDNNNMISGVTEETAQLLASYINGIRAEQARQGLKIDDIDTNIGVLVGIFNSYPTLVDYVAKIEAHTFNIATDTRAILGRINDIITTEGGQYAVRILD